MLLLYFYMSYYPLFHLLLELEWVLAPNRILRFLSLEDPEQKKTQEAK